MKTWGNEITVIRRFLRDPKGNIWSSALLLDLWNEVQDEVQRLTEVLQDVRTISIPPRFHASYTYDWEYGHAKEFGDTFYHCLRPQNTFFTACFYWEIQERTGREADIADAELGLVGEERVADLGSALMARQRARIRRHHRESDQHRDHHRSMPISASVNLLSSILSYSRSS